MQVTDEMVSRFLAWELPADFAPDGGVTFAREFNMAGVLVDRANMAPHFWPVGTNLLTAEQARAMLEHVLGGLPEPMTREFCAAYPGTAAGIINALARQIDGTPAA